jgi:TRAP-type C4-dicarboxylate transport system permease small subunit
MGALDKLAETVEVILQVAGRAFLVAMMVLACANIFLRLLGHPISGHFELLGFFGACLFALNLGLTERQRGHISVDLLFNRFPARWQTVLETVGSVASMLFFGVVSWQLFVWADIIAGANEVSETLRIPFYPFMYVVAVGCLFLAFVLLLNVLGLVRHLKRHGG